MPLVSRQAAEAAQTKTPTKEVPMASLGGDVVVRGMSLIEHLSFEAWKRSASKPREGETEEDANLRAGVAVVMRRLATQVVLEDDKPMWPAERWAEHARAHLAEILEVHKACLSLNGEDAEPAKN